MVIGMIRAVTAANPPAPTDQFGRTRTKLVAALARARGKRRSSKSSSDSSGSSSSDSESSGSSSSSSRDGSPPPKRGLYIILSIYYIYKFFFSLHSLFVKFLISILLISFDLFKN